MNAAAELPLFPLHTVLFPGGKLALKIFETRYLDMIGRCFRDSVTFGVVAIASGSEVGEAELHAVGTFAEIVDWQQLPNGLLGIAVVGRGRFGLGSTRRLADGLYVGAAAPWPEEPPCELPKSARGRAVLLRRALARLGRADEGTEADFVDASWVSYRLAEVLPLALADRQKVLATASALERLALLDGSLRTK